MFWGKDGIESILDKYRETTCSCEVCLIVLRDSTLKLVHTFCSTSECDASGVHIIFDDLGKELWKEQCYAKAAIAFEVAHSVKPNSARFLTHLAITAYKSGLLEKCVELCEDALKLTTRDDPRLRTVLKELNSKAFFDKATLTQKSSPLRKVWQSLKRGGLESRISSLLHQDDFSSLEGCLCGGGSSGNTDDKGLAIKMFSSHDDESSSSDSGSESGEDNLEIHIKPDGAKKMYYHVPLLCSKWPSSYDLPTSKLASSFAPCLFKDKHRILRESLNSKEMQLVKCEAVRSLHQKMYECSVLRLSDHFHASAQAPDLRHTGLCFTPDKRIFDSIIEPNQDWSSQYYQVQKYLTEKATTEVFVPNYESNSNMSTLEIDDALNSFSFIPKHLKDHEFERRAVEEWIHAIGVDIFGPSFFETRRISFEKYFGPHQKVKNNNLRKRKKQRKAPCSTQCVPCWAKRMWTERFDIGHNVKVGEGDKEWAKVGFFGSGKELDASKEAAVLHSVVFLCVLQCQAHWCGTVINRESDVQWLLVEALLRNHDLGSLRCGILSILELMFRMMKDETFKSKVQSWKANNRASDVALRVGGRIIAKGPRQSCKHLQDSQEDCAKSWAFWAYRGEVKREEEYAYRIMFRELSLYALGCADSRLREEYAIVMSKMFDKDPMTCYCCGPRRVLVRSVLARSKVLLDVDVCSLNHSGYEEKLAILDKVLQHRRRCPRYVYARATTHMSKGDYKSAEKDCRKALEMLLIPDRKRVAGIEYPENLRTMDMDFKASALKLLGDIHIQRSKVATSFSRQIALRQEALKYYHFSRIEYPHNTLRSALLDDCIHKAEARLELDKDKKLLFSIPDDGMTSAKNISPLIDPIPADIEPIWLATEDTPQGVTTAELEEPPANAESEFDLTELSCAYVSCKEQTRDIKRSDVWAEGTCNRKCSFVCHKNCWRAYCRESGGVKRCVNGRCDGQIKGKVLFLNAKNATRKRAQNELAQRILEPTVSSECTTSNHDSDLPSELADESKIDADPVAEGVISADSERRPERSTALQTATKIAGRKRGKRYCTTCQKELNGEYQYMIHIESIAHRKKVAQKRKSQKNRNCRRNKVAMRGRTTARWSSDEKRGSGTTYERHQMNSFDVLDAITDVLKLSNGSAHISEIRNELSLESFGLKRGVAGKYADDTFSLREVIRMNSDILSLEEAPYEVPMDPQVAYLGDLNVDEPVSQKGLTKKPSIRTILEATPATENMWVDSEADCQTAWF